MRSTDPRGSRPCSHPQLGFSMVEMLMAAFIMAVGLLGLAMLQTMALRSNTGSKSMTSAVLVAERVLDQAEALGRNSLLCARNGSTVPALTPNYFGAAAITQYFQYDGTYSDAAAYFTVTTTPTDVVGAIATSAAVSATAAGVGGLKLVSVSVSWSEGVDAAKAAIPRSVVLSRRISYAKP